MEGRIVGCEPASSWAVWFGRPSAGVQLSIEDRLAEYYTHARRFNNIPSMRIAMPSAVSRCARSPQQTSIKAQRLSLVSVAGRLGLSPRVTTRVNIVLSIENP